MSVGVDFFFLLVTVTVNRKTKLNKSYGCEEKFLQFVLMEYGMDSFLRIRQIRDYFLLMRASGGYWIETDGVHACKPGEKDTAANHISRTSN